MKKNLLNKKRKSKAFTLVELIIVIAIIAILAAAAVPKYLEIKEKSNVKADVSVAKNLKTITETLIAEESISYNTTIDLTGSLSGDAKEVGDLMDTDDFNVKAKKYPGCYFSIKVDNNGDVTVSAKDSSGKVIDILPEDTDNKYGDGILK